jgi:hypothetical protein
MTDTTPKSPDEIRDEIERTRADLAQTVDSLSAKLDVKAQAKQRVDDLRVTVTEKAKQAQPYRTQILGATAGLAVLLVAVRLRRRRRPAAE